MLETDANQPHIQPDEPLDINHYQKGIQFAEAGQYQQALDCLQEHLRTFGDDAQAINDTGAVLHCLGFSDKAIDYFLKAHSLKPDSAQIIWNLVESYLAVDKPAEAAQLFNDMEQMCILNPDVLNRTANAFLKQDNKANAIEMLLYSLKVSPQQPVLESILQVIRSKRPKVAFFCGGDGSRFLNDIIEFIKQRFEVRVFDGSTEQQLFELTKSSDICWFEWCTNLAMIASNMPKVSKNIVRLHRYEAYEQWPQQINWSNVDTLIMVGNSFVKDALLRSVPQLQSHTSIVTIPNGVNLERFPFMERQHGKNIAFLANLRMVKNPAFVLQCMQKLHYIDPAYRLFFAGTFQDAALEQYLRYMVDALDLRDVVFFDGWQDDIASWLKDKHYIVSTSIIESQGMGVLEGMACGLKPVIHNFPGADQIFPSEFLFNISEQFCRQVLCETYEPRKYRKFVEDNYYLNNQLNKINDLFIQFETQIDFQQAQTPVGADLQNKSVRKSAMYEENPLRRSLAAGLAQR